MFQQRVLLITPFHKSQRGNSITTERICEGLLSRGVPAERLSLEEENWPQRLASLLESGIGIVHGFNAHYFGGLLEKVPGLLACPLVITLTGTDINSEGRKGSPSVAAVLGKARHLVVFHEDFKARLAAWGWSPSGISVVPQGVALPPAPARSRKDLGIPVGTFVFLLPTGLRPVKNIELALDALEDLAREGQRIHLLIMGAVIDEAYGKSILARAAGLPWVTYLGEVPHAEMEGVLRVGDAVINCSRSEGQPQAALEAMSLGLPAVLTDVPGNSGIISNGREGFYIRTRRELTSAARVLVNDPAGRRQMGAAAAELVGSRFSPAAEIDRHIEIYRMISTRNTDNGVRLPE